MLKRNMQLRLQPVLTEFQTADQELMLKLPTTAQQLDRQVTQIFTARQRLVKLQLQIQRYLIKEVPRQLRQQLHILLHGTRDLVHIADSLLLLAEEYPLDPEGAIACLQQINRRKSNLLQQVQRSVASANSADAIAKYR